jgi:hypothetical protein
MAQARSAGSAPAARSAGRRPAAPPPAWAGLYLTDSWGQRTRVGRRSALILWRLANAPNAATVSTRRLRPVWGNTDGAQLTLRQRTAAVDTRLRSAVPIPSGSATGRAYRKNDVASRWEPVGTPIPDAQAKPSGIHVLN